MVCTGKKNYLIEDKDSTFLPGGGTLLPSNPEIGDKLDTCQFYSSMNGHHCLQNNFGVLEYESNPPMNARIMWPVTLSYDDGPWVTQTNGYKEWEWDGNEPLNKRLARFISVIEYQKIYNMTFAGTPPLDMRLQFQKRVPEGNNSDWIIVKLHYPFPNMIRIQNSKTGQVVRPIPLLDFSA